MTDHSIIAMVLGAFSAGLWLGSFLEAKQWRIKGDHDYMNRKESGGHFYTVKRDD